LAFVSIIQILGSAINAIYSNKIHGKMEVVGSSTFLWHVLHMPIEFFTQRMTGDIQSRQNSNASIAGNLVNTIAPMALNFALVIFYLVVMVRYSWIMTLVGVASMIINLALARVISNKRINISRVHVRDAAKLDSATVAGVEMIETIKASGAENGYFEKWSGYQASMNTQLVKFTKANLYLTSLPALVSTIMTVIVTMMGVYSAIHGNFTVGMIMAFQGFLTSFTTPATSLINAGQTVSEMRTAMERIEDVMQYPTAPCFQKKESSSTEQSYDKLSGQIELKNVTFGYSPLSEPLIRDFSMSIKPGSRVAFVGASGCGKSTIAKLISGLYRPWSGEISFDGVPIDEIDRNVFTGSVAVVDQDLIIFEESISNNIKMWDESIEDFEMILAANDAQIHEDIMQREGGYQYSLHEGGKNFSGGQRQRLEIARALAQDPTVIIMDEATSALDARTEREVVKAISDRGITCIVIAHRLSTIRDCDEILVLEHGVVVERGSHEELLAKGGKYTALVSSD
jgi:ABC-type bacteriocin/lantibiotic exporter with double-glycine peptidase domain